MQNFLQTFSVPLRPAAHKKRPAALCFAAGLQIQSVIPRTYSIFSSKKQARVTMDEAVGSVRQTSHFAIADWLSPVFSASAIWLRLCRPRSSFSRLANFFASKSTLSIPLLYSVQVLKDLTSLIRLIIISFIIEYANGGRAHTCNNHKRHGGKFFPPCLYGYNGGGRQFCLLGARHSVIAERGAARTAAPRAKKRRRPQGLRQ